MEQGLILLVAALMICAAPGVQGMAGLFSDNNTQVQITQVGCGLTKVCVETPPNCAPTENNCLFGSLVASPPMAPNGSDLSIQLSGESMGYIAVGLTVNASEGTAMLFICARNNETFIFGTMQKNNSDAALTTAEMLMTDVKGNVNGTLIQCQFNVNITNTTIIHVTATSVLLGTGEFDGNILGPFNISLERGPLNLTDPTSNFPAPNTTTAAPTTVKHTTPTSSISPTSYTYTTSHTSSTSNTSPTSHTSSTSSTSHTMASSTTPSGSSGAVHPHAVLLLLSVLPLFVMLRA